MPVPRKILDFGCGQGYYLDALKHYGYVCKGIEIAPESARFAQEKGHEVSLDSLSYPDSYFDCVVSIHVFEHIEDLSSLLPELKRMLKSGAFFHFEVPNFDSLQARLFPFKWFHADMGIHYHHFTPRSFKGLLQSNGFRVSSIEFGSFEQGIMGWAQSIYNKAFPYNRFYRMFLWNRTLKDNISAWPELLLLPIVFPISFLLYLVERLAGNGPVIRVEGAVGNESTK
jgi:SAM-dependent methyltransferase